MRVDLSADCKGQLSAVADFLEARAIRGWVVGGFVRDSLLGIPAADIDITIDGDPLALGPDLAKDLAASFVVLDAGRRHARFAQR